jgi:hypothetical protein
VADDRWRSADLTWERIDEYFARNPEPLVSASLKRTIENLERCAGPDCTEEERRAGTLLAYQLTLRGAATNPAARASPRSELQDLREQHIAETLKAVLRRRADRIVLIVGAQHAWALEPMLVHDLGFTLESMSWQDVLSCDLSDLGGNAREPTG